MDWVVADDYAIARWLASRGIAAIYLIAFINVVDQWRPLLGRHGLTPVPEFTARVPARAAPSLFHRWYSDRLALGLGWLGILLSATLVAGLPQRGPSWVPMLAFAVLWLLYLSYVNVGQTWYGFGWESILLDAGAIAILLGSDAAAPTWPVVLLLRWLVFRIEFGAGLIKIRGDPCWRDLTCLEYHHETQPMPSLLSWYFHRMPKPAHRIETGANHVVQLLLPFGLFLPQPIAGVAATAIIVTQGWLVFSGNFSWLNAITIVLATSGLSDGWLDWLPVDVAMGPALAAPARWWLVLVLAAAAATLVASRHPVMNMLSSRQRMNASFNPYHLVGTYGAFGSVTRTRYEVVLEGTRDPRPGPDSDWREYGFKAKPTDPQRRPRQWAPYHLRLDWLMWFLAFGPLPGGRHHRWFGRLVQALLEADPGVLRLLRHDPFGGQPPTAVRARRYVYRFTTPAQRRATGAWWDRELVGEFLAPTPGRQ
jgi:hypothetical protein